MKNFLFILFISILFLLSSCSEHSSSTSEEVDHGELDLGKTVNESIKAYLSQTQDGDLKLQVYALHEDQVIDGVNHIFDTNSIKKCGCRDNRFKNSPSSPSKKQIILKKLYELIENNILPQLTDNLGIFLEEISKDKLTIKALTDFFNSHTCSNWNIIVNLIYKMLKQEHNKELWIGVRNLIQNNPQLIKNISFLIYKSLINLPEDENTAILQLLTKKIENTDLIDDLGRELWGVKIDENGNPKVLKDEEGNIYPPFIDQDGDGVCDIDPVTRKPIDKNGKILNILPISNEKYIDEEGNLIIDRDEYGRAINPNDNHLIFEYYDIKKTLLAIILVNLHKIYEKNDTIYDLYKFLKIALLPLKDYVDELGPYQGFSDESDIIKSLTKGIELLKNPQTRYLIQGLGIMISQQNTEQLEQAFISFGDMIWEELRDNPNINNIEDLEKWFENFGANPPHQIFPLLQLMGQTEIPEVGNMFMLFIGWISQNYEKISKVLWPLIKTLRKVKLYYINDPTLEKRLYDNSIKWLKWSFYYKIKINDNYPPLPLATILINNFIKEISINTEQKIELMQKNLVHFIKSRWFIYFMKCIEKFLNSPEYPIFKKVITCWTTPQPAIENDIYSGLVKLGTNILTYKKNLLIKLKLLKMIGKFFNPKLPIVINFLDTFSQLILADKDVIFLKILQGTFSKCQKHNLPPITMFTYAYIDVLKVSIHNITKQLTEKDIESILLDISDFFLNPNEILKRVYRVIIKNKK